MEKKKEDIAMILFMYDSLLWMYNIYVEGAIKCAQNYFKEYSK